MNNLRLTQTVQKGGCAAKIAALELRKILGGVRFPPHGPELLIDTGTFDDAAIYKINNETALVQTLDFFTPIVDSPEMFGRIAAANAISDVYAMGGRPVTAMAILAFPLGTLSNEVITQVLQGACQVLEKSGASLSGGHSIDDESLKFGLSVTGLVHPEKIWSNQGAREGDVLILTKPIGTGCSTAALKRSAVSENEIHDVIESMATLNNVPDILTELDLKNAIHACTDITGFGLAGHSMQMAKSSRQSFEFNFSAIPYFERAPAFLNEGFLTKAHRTNREYVEQFLSESASSVSPKEIYGELSDWQKHLIFDPQTSGGLLMSVSADKVESLVGKLKPHFARVSAIGKVCAHKPGLPISFRV
jgi:selenide, water dikinase